VPPTPIYAESATRHTGVATTRRSLTHRGDWNADTNDLTWINFWWALGLYAPIKKGIQGGEATYNRGSLQVDNIYVSSTLQHLEYTMVPIDEGVSGADHKALLLQIPKTEMGIGPMPIQKH